MGCREHNAYILLIDQNHGKGWSNTSMVCGKMGYYGAATLYKGGGVQVARKHKLLVMICWGFGKDSKM